MINFSTNTQRVVTEDMLRQIACVTLPFPGVQFDGLGDVEANNGHALLSYIKDGRYASAVNDNPAIRGVLCPEGLERKFRADVVVLPCIDPTFAFFSLIDHMARFVFEDTESTSDSEYDATRVHVAKKSVFIGKNVVLEPGVVIHEGVTIGDDCIVRAGAVLGLDTFQHQRTKQGIISPAHNGFLKIGSRVEIGANATFSKGFSYRSTIIGNDVKCDAQTYLGHGASVADASFICAGARIMGHAQIGSECFIGPGATISSRIVLGPKTYVSLGSVVTKSNPGHTQLTGNFAIPHEMFVRNLKDSVRP